MGRMVIIPGTSALSIQNAPKITMTDWERQVANLPGLRHVVDPDKLKSDGSGRDRFSGAPITPKGVGVNAKIDADPGFNNLPVINVTANSGGLYIGPGGVTQSVSFLCVASITAAARASAATKGLMNTVSDANVYRHSLRVVSGAALRFYSDNADTAYNVATTEYFPAGDVAGVWGFSYDAGSNQSALLYSDASLINLQTHLLEPSIAANDRYIYGGGGLTFGWIGKLGIGLFFDRAMHLPTMLPFFQQGVSLLKQKYGLP